MGAHKDKTRTVKAQQARGLAVKTLIERHGEEYAQIHDEIRQQVGLATVAEAKAERSRANVESLAKRLERLTPEEQALLQRIFGSAA